MPLNIPIINSPYANGLSQNSSTPETQKNNVGKGFSALLKDKLSQADALQKEADKLTEKFVVGEPVEMHQVMLAMEKADIALREMVEIRNKLIEAYKEVSHMQV